MGEVHKESAVSNNNVTKETNNNVTKLCDDNVTKVTTGVKTRIEFLFYSFPYLSISTSS